MNTNIEQILLKKITDERKYNSFNEDELITENGRKYLKLLRKYDWDEGLIMSALSENWIEEYGTDIISLFPSSTELNKLIQLIREEKWKQNVLLIRKQAIYEDDTEKLKQILSSIPEFPEEVEELSLNEVADEVVMGILWEWKPIVKVPTWFKKLDEKLDWWFYPWTLNIVAWRPWTWKSAFSLNIFDYQTLHNKCNWVYFSLEMWKKEVLQRIFSKETWIEFSKIRSWAWTDGLDKVDNTLQLIKESNIKIIDNMFKFNNICNKIRDLSKEWLDIAYIDYLWLMEIKADSRYMEISIMTRRLKELSRECNIPIVLLAQLNRNDSGRADKTPQLSDLRDSWSIEQDADSVIMLYKPDEDWKDIELWLRKNRNGPSDIVINYLSDYKYMSIGEKEASF